MNIIIIWHKNTEYIKYEIKNILTDANITCISTPDQLTEYLKSNIIPDHVFILVELYWETKDFYGYDVALRLLKKIDVKNKAKAPNIQFISLLYNRDELFALTSGVHRCFVKSFKHYLIQDKISIPNDDFPINYWRYLRGYALEESGILDDIVHKYLNRISSDNIEENNRKSLQITNELTSVIDICGDRIKGLIEQFSKNPKEQNDFLKKIKELLQERILELNPEKAKVKFEQRKSKKNLIIVEDDLSQLEQLKKLFEEYFTIFDFVDGSEALTKLKSYGLIVDVLITDLELLVPNKSYLQDVQGIHLINYVKEREPHIAVRVITGKGRLGVTQMLPEMKESDILYKRYIELYKGSELFFEFLQKLDNDITKNSEFGQLVGPNSSLWRDKDAKNSEGRGLKRFYYELKVGEKDRFNQMWDNIKHTVNEVFKIDASIRIDTSFGKIDNRYQRKEIKYLEHLLIHRAIILNRYNDTELVRYKDEANKKESYIHMSCWNASKKSGLPSNPKQYFGFLGFGCPGLDPPEPRENDEMIFFYLNYKTLFPEETSLIPKKHKSDFYNNNEAFCVILNSCLHIIIQDQKNNIQSNFKGTYPNYIENTHKIEESYCKKILEGICSENRTRSIHSSREKVHDYLDRFQYSLSENDDEIFTPEYQNLPKDIKTIFDKALKVLE